MDNEVFWKIPFGKKRKYLKIWVKFMVSEEKKEVCFDNI